MDRLRCIQVFLAVARAGSFTAAAQYLGISKANVTRHVAHLEEIFGSRLINRTTTQVCLTDAGQATFASGKLLVEQYDEMEASSRKSTRGLKGLIHLGTPPSFGITHLPWPMAKFVERYPDVQFSISIDLGSANLVSRNLDVSVRIGPPPEDASYIAVPLITTPQVLVAAPSYLNRQGVPEKPDDLTTHNCLVHLIKSPTHVWSFHDAETKRTVQVSGTLRSNFGEILKSAALMGHGISMHPTYMVSEDLSSGNLVQVMPGFRPPSLCPGR